MIRSVRIQNFKSLRDVSVELERFTVFVGANGSGKTSVLEAIHNAVRAVIGAPQRVFAHDRHGDWVYTRGGRGDLSIYCWTAGGPFGVVGTPPLGYLPMPELMGKKKWEYGVSSPEGAIEPALGLIFMRLDAALMSRPSYSEDDPPRMNPTGQGLASVLAYMALTDPQGFDDLVGVARTLIPRLRRIRFRKAPVYRTERELVRFGKDTVERTSRRQYQGESILLDFDHADNVSARTASEGTMLMLGLLTVLLGPSRPSILLLDDIEHGLHPLAQKQMVAVIGQVLQRFPDLQILATAHSPYLLNHLDPEQVRIMATDSEGHAICGRLTDHPQFETWKEEMAPGEMWSLFGERWLANEGAAT